MITIVSCSGHTLEEARRGINELIEEHAPQGVIRQSLPEEYNPFGPMQWIAYAIVWSNQREMLATLLGQRKGGNKHGSQRNI